MIDVDFYVNSYKAINCGYNGNQLYFIPHIMLRKYISNYTLTYSSMDSNSDAKGRLSDDLVIIPDGSGCMIYSFNGEVLDEIFWGPTTKYVKVKKNNTTSNVKERMFFIEFLPGGIYALIGIPQRELVDLKCSIKEIDKKLSISLSDAIKSSKTIDELIFKVDRILIKRIGENNKIDKRFLSFVNKIKATGGTMPVKKLAEGEYISERQLNRIFEKAIGLSPKMFSRVVRINNAIKTYKANNIFNFTYVSYDSGFYDQSHLIREFYQFCGTTPSNFINNMSDFYNEPFKF